MEIIVTIQMQVCINLVMVLPQIQSIKIIIAHIVILMMVLTATVTKDQDAI